MKGCHSNHVLWYSGVRLPPGELDIKRVEDISRVTMTSVVQKIHLSNVFDLYKICYWKSTWRDVKIPLNYGWAPPGAIRLQWVNSNFRKIVPWDQINFSWDNVFMPSMRHVIIYTKVTVVSLHMHTSPGLNDTKISYMRSYPCTKRICLQKIYHTDIYDQQNDVMIF